MTFRVAILWLAGVLIAPAGAELSVTKDFEAGSIGDCKTVGENHLECGVIGEVDQDGRNRQASWFYIRVDGAEGTEITVDLVDLPGEYNYKPNNGPITDKTPPVISYDNKTWTHLTEEELDYDAEQPRLRMRFQPEKSPVWIARLAPYTTKHLEDLLSRYKDSRFLKQEVIGKTVEGRDLLLLTITNPGDDQASKKVMWFMFRQHAWESDTSWVCEGAIRFLLGGSHDAHRIRSSSIIKIMPMCDPDGVVRGGVRYNANGYDLNRNWDTFEPKKMPEIAAQHKAVADWIGAGNEISLFLSLHNTETAEYIAGPPEGAHPLHADVMFRLYQMLRRFSKFSATRDPALSKPSTDADKPGRMTVVQGLGRDFDIAAMLMELMIAKPLKLPGPPTVNDRLRFGMSLIAASAMSAPDATVRNDAPGGR